MKKTTKHKMKGFTLVELLVVIGIIAVLAGIGTPLILRAQKQGALADATSNAKTIATALNQFRDDKGRFPCDATRESLLEDGVDNLPEGDSATTSNGYLAQLIVTKQLDTETVFFAKGAKGAIDKGDDIMRPGELLKKGEVGFSCILAEDGESLSADKSVTPLIIAPLKKGGETPTFDPSPYGGKYVYGTVAGNAIQGEITDDGLANSKGRESLFDSGRDSLFGSDIPVIVAPDGF